MFARDLFLGLFLGEMAHMLALAERGRFDALRAGRVERPILSRSMTREKGPTAGGSKGWKPAMMASRGFCRSAKAKVSILWYRRRGSSSRARNIAMGL